MNERLRVRIPAEAAGEFIFPELTFCADSSVVSSTPVLRQGHVKDPGHSAKSAGGRLQLNTYTPLTQRSRSGLTMPVSRQVWEPVRKRATCQGTLGHSRLSSLSRCVLGLNSGVRVRQLIFTVNKSAGQARSEWSNILPESSQARKKPSPPPPPPLSPLVQVLQYNRKFNS